MQEEKASCSPLFPITGIPRERCVSIFVIHFRVFPVFVFVLKWKDFLQSLASRGGNWSAVSRQKWVGRTLRIPRISESKEAEHRPLRKSPIGCTLAPQLACGRRWPQPVWAGYFRVDHWAAGLREARPPFSLFPQHNRLLVFPSRLVSYVDPGLSPEVIEGLTFIPR